MVQRPLKRGLGAGLGHDTPPGDDTWTGVRGIQKNYIKKQGNAQGKNGAAIHAGQDECHRLRGGGKRIKTDVRNGKKYKKTLAILTVIGYNTM
ncbi:hypothetical protein D3Z50_03650 [Clostridiaceae bacterium]|nr:hypothetical protein [Clostridiaceae bacterium]